MNDEKKWIESYSELKSNEAKRFWIKNKFKMTYSKVVVAQANSAPNMM